MTEEGRGQPVPVPAAGRFFVSIFEKAKITEKLTAVVSEQQFPVE